MKGRFGNAILDIKMKVQYKLSNNTMKVQHQTSNLSDECMKYQNERVILKNQRAPLCLRYKPTISLQTEATLWFMFFQTDKKMATDTTVSEHHKLIYKSLKDTTIKIAEFFHLLYQCHCFTMVDTPPCQSVPHYFFEIPTKRHLVERC